MAFLPTSANFVSSLNSTSSPLDAGATFEGAPEMVVHHIGAAIYVHTDRDGILVVQQTASNAKWTTVTQKQVHAGRKLELNVHFNGKYARVKFSNTSREDQTFLHIVTTLAISSDSNVARLLQTGVPHHETSTDAFMRLKTALPETIFHSKSVLDDQHTKWTQFVSGEGAVVFHPERANLGLTIPRGSPPSAAVRQSREHVTYYPGRGMEAMFTGCLCSSVDASGCAAVGRIGIFDDVADKSASEPQTGDGCFWQLDYSTMQMSVVRP